MSSGVLLFLTTFVASAVEAVEALTIVLAVGVVRGWRSTLFGVGAAALALAAVVVALGSALSAIPIDTLRLVVGALLLAFGLQWLRKAILRASGFKPLHDEAAAFARERREAEDASPVGGTRIDWYSFTVAFKGVLLEGLEVAFIVITFGTTQSRLGLAAAAAAAAVVLVVAVGLAVRAPLERVPENALKFVVGLLLTSFGIFWGGEGAGVSWPGSDVAIVAILAFLALFSFALVRQLRRNDSRHSLQGRAHESPARFRRVLVELRRRRRLARRIWCRRRARYLRTPGTSGTRRLVGPPRDGGGGAASLAATRDASEGLTDIGPTSGDSARPDRDLPTGSAWPGRDVARTCESAACTMSDHGWPRRSVRPNGCSGASSSVVTTT